MNEREALNTKIWGLIVSYGAATSLHDEALRIDVGVRKAADTCDGVEDELRQSLAALASAPAAPQAEPVYQVLVDFPRHLSYGWVDVDREFYEADTVSKKRVLYAAPTPQATAPAEQPSGTPGELAHEIWSAAQLAPGEGIEDAVGRIAALLTAQAPAGVEAAQQGQAAAWMHEDDPARVISDMQKAQALRDGGASASSVRPYCIALPWPNDSKPQEGRMP